MPLAPCVLSDRMSALSREIGSRGRADAVVAADEPEPCPAASEEGQAESAEASRSLKLSLDKTTRAKQELMSRATRAEESLKEVEAQKEALEKAQQGAPRPVCAGVAADWEHTAAPPSRAPRPS